MSNKRVTKLVYIYYIPTNIYLLNNLYFFNSKILIFSYLHI